MVRRGLVLVAIAVSLTLGVLTPASAQTQTGTITGLIVDEQNAVLPGVAVTLTSEALIRPRSTVSNEGGSYTFVALPPGTYQVKFELQGFNAVERAGITVAVATVTTVNQMLKVAT